MAAPRMMSPSGPEGGDGTLVGSQLVCQPKEGAADEAAAGTADSAVAQLAQRTSGDALAQADRQPKECPAQAARQHRGQHDANGFLIVGHADPPDQLVVDLLAEEDAQRRRRAEEQATGGQAGKPDQGAVADRLDADDEVPNGAADKDAAEQDLAREQLLRD